MTRASILARRAGPVIALLVAVLLVVTSGHVHAHDHGHDHGGPTVEAAPTARSAADGHLHVRAEDVAGPTSEVGVLPAIEVVMSPVEGSHDHAPHEEVGARPVPPQLMLMTVEPVRAGPSQVSRHWPAPPSRRGDPHTTPVTERVVLQT